MLHRVELCVPLDPSAAPRFRLKLHVYSNVKRLHPPCPIHPLSTQRSSGNKYHFTWSCLSLGCPLEGSPVVTLQIDNEDKFYGSRIPSVR